MRRTSWFTAGSLLLLAVPAACRDGIMSPVGQPVKAPSAGAPAPISLAPQARPSLQLSGGLPDSASTDFVVGPSGGVFFAGNHAVIFPSQSVCDPATSSYGPTEWDVPCAPLQSPLKIHAEVRRANGQTSVDFTPSLRFVPSTNPARWVWIVMYTPEAVNASTDLSRFNIVWIKSLGAEGVDETPFDSTLRTYVDTWQGLSMRRIKHFSGYLVGAGRDDTGSSPPP
jgi:hypothetical protein